MFHCIPAVRNTEAKFKVETFQEFITEKMALYHSEFIHWFLSHNKFYPEMKKKYELYYWIFITPILGRIIKSESFYRSCLESLIIHAKHFDNTPGIEIDFFFYHCNYTVLLLNNLTYWRARNAKKCLKSDVTFICCLQRIF